MGLFSKKKNSDASSSVLSETEIQKKLYGEFSDRTSHVVIGDREPFRESASAPFVSKEASPEKDVSFDLFSAQKDALAESAIKGKGKMPPQPRTPEEIKAAVEFMLKAAE